MPNQENILYVSILNPGMDVYYHTVFVMPFKEKHKFITTFHVTMLKINKLLSIYTINLLMRFGLDIQIQTKVKSLETKKIQYGHQVAIF